MGKVLLVVAALAVAGAGWECANGGASRALAGLRAGRPSASDGRLPSDWARRYGRAIDAVRARADRVFEAMVRVRTDRAVAERAQQAADADVRARNAVLDDLAAAIRAAGTSGELTWQGERLASPAEARQRLALWEAELVASERQAAGATGALRSLRTSERRMAAARRRLLARADAMRRDMHVNRARLDAAAARRALGEVERAGAPGLGEDLAGVDDLIALIDRSLLAAEAREALEAEEESAGGLRGSLAEAVEAARGARAGRAVAERVAARLQRVAP